MWGLILTVFLAGSPGWPAVERAWAQEQPAPTPGVTAAEPEASQQPNVDDLWQVQAVLAALGMYNGPLTGVHDEATREALLRFQRAYRLPATGVLDRDTLAFLGGSAATLDRHPRFLYTVQPGDTLSGLAARFRVPMPRIVRYNPSITSVHRIYAGHQLVIPVEFPIPDHFKVLRLQVLSQRFLGSYLVDVPFADADRLANDFAQLLRERGFEVQVEKTALDGITVRNRAVGLGRITFSPFRSEGLTRVDVGLLAAGSGATSL
ncbi:MAG TPA: peptidoglycan-binding protein [Limnochordales bacterium]